jgi:biopolymer transport protein ExbD
MALRFQRTTRLIRGQFDLAPFMCVIFALLFFMLFGGYLVLPRGTPLVLPKTGAPPMAWSMGGYMVVVVDANNQLYFENQVVDPDQFRQKLAIRAGAKGGPTRLYLQADRTVAVQKIIEIGELAQAAGVREVVVGAVAEGR